ncbi:MAG: diacylglycerol kinase, partial [Actinomyces sp.]
MVEKEAGARSTFPYEVDSATVNFGPECRSQRASTPTAAPLACIVVNPSKPSATDAVRRRTTDVLRGAGYAGPLWLETTPAEPGTMQARLAVASGARLH